MRRHNLIRWAAAAAALAIAGCGETPDEIEAPPSATATGRTVAVVRSRVPITVTAAGTLQPAVGAMLSTRMMGRVADVPVSAGDRVKKGDVVARLEGADLRARRRQAEAGVAAARAVLADAEASIARMRNLIAAGAVSQAQFDAAEAGYAQARQGLARAEGMLAEVRAHMQYTVIRTPFDGIVTGTHVEAGDMASPGIPVVGIEQPGMMKVKVAMSERDRKAAVLTGRVRVEVDGGDATRPIVPVEGTITEINTSVDPRSRTFQVEVAISDPDAALMSGAFARVRFPAGERDAIVVPETAIVRRGQLEGVYVVDGNARRVRWVRLGHEVDGGREVLSGLDGGETIWLPEE